jgi:hypothetical protein
VTGQFALLVQTVAVWTEQWPALTQPALLVQDTPVTLQVPGMGDGQLALLVQTVAVCTVQVPACGHCALL